ncbi:MAG TPA: hypothetical protein VIR30_19005, partial [Nocardioides sp.]
MAVLVALALSSAGAIMYAIESARLDRAATAQAEQEIAEFRTLQEQGKDPNTAQDFASIRDLMRVFLERNVPSDNELFVAWVEGKAAFVSASDRRGFGGSDELASLVARHVEDGAEFRADSSVGELLVTVQPVHGGVQSRCARGGHLPRRHAGRPDQPDAHLCDLLP